MKLYDFQKEGVEFALAHNYTINGCEMGLGKTVQAIEVMKKLKTKTLIVCPAYLRDNWAHEIKKFAPDWDDSLSTILSYNQFVMEYNEYYSCDLVIFDEAHYLKNVSSQRTMRSHYFVKACNPTHLMLLTGTPVMNRVTEFYSLLKLCSYSGHNTNGIPVKYGFAKFASVLTNVSYVSGNSGFTVKKYTGLRNKDILDKYLDKKYFRRMAKDALDLPPLVQSNIYTTAAPTKEDELELEKAFGDKDADHISVAKAKSAAFKARTTAQYVGELLDQGEGPVIVYTDHKVAGQFIYDHLKYKYAAAWINGSTATTVRSKAITNVEAKVIQVIIATIGSFSTGVNLTASNQLIFNDMSWTPANNMQAEKRIHRIGQTKTCFITYVTSRGIDYLIHENLREKMDVLRQLT
jgi:SWI/SNF-related matrix-associated actin-dependent regulator 1 of chromatin subfamily A